MNSAIIRHLLCAAAYLLHLCALPQPGLSSDLQTSEQIAKAASRILNISNVQGGLVVHVNCGDGTLTTELRQNDSLLVQGLSSDRASVTQTRKRIRSLGGYGPVSVDFFDGAVLPYTDNLVRLLILDGDSSVSRADIQRVLCPGGVAVTLNDELKIVQQWRKPWPQDIDEWTHWLHDSGKSSVARDSQVGPPRRMQWLAGPLWARGHEVVSSIGAVVTANGRIFSVIDEGQTGIYSLPSQWALVARDAFSGVLLWKRQLPHWTPPVALGGFANGFQPQRLVTDGQVVYLPTGADAVLTAIDAASGKELRTLDNAKHTREILLEDGLMVVMTQPTLSRRQPRQNQNARPSIIGTRADTLSQLWSVNVAPSTMLLSAGRAIYFLNNRVVALDANTGQIVWNTPVNVTTNKGRRRQPTLTMRVHSETLYIECASRLVAISTNDGSVKWDRTGAPVSKGELFAVGGRLWRPQGSTIFGHDIATGQVREKIDASAVFTRGHHPRCYPSKATDRYVIANNRGAEFISLTSGEHVQNDWLRGSCGHGVVPANGLLYVPPDPCFCYPGAKITGFSALASHASNGPNIGTPAQHRLAKGPAFGSARALLGKSLDAEDWPTYRNNGSRTGATTSTTPPDLATLWTTELEHPITPPTVCNGRLYVAEKNSHTLFAFAADDGKLLWTATTGGRIDSPPTILGELVIFGCADGRVYCVQASDGELVWRFQAAPSERRIVAFGQLESPWRVHGSVLAYNNLVYFTAGRSSFVDGGLFIYALDPVSGQIVHENKVDTYSTTRRDAVGKPFIPAYHIEGARSDILTQQNGNIFLGQIKFNSELKQQESPYILIDREKRRVAMPLDNEPYTVENEDTKSDYEKVQRDWIENTQKNLVAELRASHGSFNYGVRKMGLHVLTTGGFLDDSWFNRTYWMYAENWPGFYIAHRAAKAGQLLIVGPEKTYAVQAFPSRNLQSPLFTPAKHGYLLLADKNESDIVLDDSTVEVCKGRGFTRSEPPVWFDWVPIRIRGMVLADEVLFVAGPPDVVDPGDPLAAFDGRRGGVLRAYKSENGGMLKEYHLDSPPVFDGMIAASGRLFISTTGGTVVCMSSAN